MTLFLHSNPLPQLYQMFHDITLTSLPGFHFQWCPTRIHIASWILQNTSAWHWWCLLTCFHLTWAPHKAVSQLHGPGWSSYCSSKNHCSYLAQIFCLHNVILFWYAPFSSLSIFQILFSSKNISPTRKAFTNFSPTTAHI